MSRGVIETLRTWIMAEEVEGGEERASGEERKQPRRPLLSLHPARQDEIFLRRPRSLEDAQLCADCLKARRPVVVNLKSLEEGKARRVLDFLGGVVYAVDGHMEEAGEGIYLLTPNNVSISAEVQTIRDEAMFWGE